MNAAIRTTETETVTVGMGITVSIGGDRYPATIVWVSDSGKTFRFQHDTSKGSVFVMNPNAEVKTAYRNKNGDWRLQGSSSHFIHVGRRESRWDPSF